MSVGVVTVLFRPHRPELSPRSARTGYGPEWVNRLYRQFKYYLGTDFTFCCLTDHTEGFDPAIRTVPLLLKYRGWWTLNEAMRPDLGFSRVVFAQLDTVVCGALWDLIEAPHPVMMAADRRMQGHSGFCIWDQEVVTPLWHRVMKEGDGLANRMTYRGFPAEMVYWRHTLAPHAKVFNRDVFPGRVMSYKREWQHGTYLKARNQREPFEKASVVWFHGRPKVTQLPEDHVLREVE